MNSMESLTTQQANPQNQIQAQQSRSILRRIENAAVSRWKLETLTGLLGFRALQKHQSETEKNIAAENRHVRKSVWGETAEQETTGDDVARDTILGDNIHYPTPVFATQPSSTAGKVIAGAAIAASLIGIPGAGVIGYLASQLANKSQPVPVPVVQDEDLDVGLGTIDELVLDEEK